jgi:NTE family protein
MIKRACALAFSIYAALSPVAAAPSDAPDAALAAAPRPRVALVLSGGSALGIAHIGVIRELERAGIPIDMVLGTSIGSLVGGLYASGYSPDRMEAIVTGLDWSAFFSERRDTPGGRYLRSKYERFPLGLGFDRNGFLLDKGLIKGQNILAFLSALTLHVLPTRNFDELPVPFRAVAADIVTGEKVVFSAGSIAEAMRASMSIPGLFSPYEAEGRSLVDGGIVDNMPVDIAREMGADIVIAVECRMRSPKSPSDLRSSLAITNQTANLFVEENMRPSRADADLLIRPDLSGFNRMSYAEAAALVARGEAQAHEAGPAILALAARIAATRPLVAPDDEPNRRAMRDPPVMDRLEIEAPSLSDEAIARGIFGGLVGRPLVRSEVEAAIDRAYASGGYSLVKFDLEPEPEGPGQGAIGVVRMIADESTKHEAFLGGSYRGLFSSFRSSEASILPALYLGDISGRDSALFVEAGIGNLTRAYAEYFQPFGPFSLMPDLRYQSQYVFYPMGQGLGLRTDFRSSGGGLQLGLILGRSADLKLGWTYESIRAVDVDIPVESSADIPAPTDSEIGSLVFELGIDNRSTTVFPVRGFSADARGRWADPSFGGRTSFVAVDLHWNAAVPLSRRFSLALAGSAATDFSGLLPDASPLPPSCLFDLRTSGMFYGLEPRPALESGNHVFGLGLELRDRVGVINPLLGGDIFVIANLSAGTAYDADYPNSSFLPLRWNPSLGLGVRVTRRFGALLAGGLVVDQNPLAPVRPALSLQVGSQVDFPEDRR